MGKDVDVELPQPFELEVDSTLGMTSFLSMAPVSVDMGLDNVKIDLDGKIDMGLDDVKIDMGLDNVNVDMGLDDVNVDMGLDNINMCMSLAIKELPSMKVQFPVNFDFGVKLLGIPLLNFVLCGKSMVLTEENSKRLFHIPKPYKPSTDATRKNNENIRVTIADS